LVGGANISSHRLILTLKKWQGAVEKTASLPLVMQAKEIPCGVQNAQR
jgi:hypothetical protein